MVKAATEAATAASGGKDMIGKVVKATGAAAEKVVKRRVLMGLLVG